MGSVTITEFIQARIAEKEAFAKGVIMAIEMSPGSFVSLGLDHPELAAGDCPSYIRDYEPDRDLAECEAKRTIVALVEAWDQDPEPRGPDYWAAPMWAALYALAAIWSDHEDYREEWNA